MPVIEVTTELEEEILVIEVATEVEEEMPVIEVTTDLEEEIPDIEVEEEILGKQHLPTDNNMRIENMEAVTSPAEITPTIVEEEMKPETSPAIDSHPLPAIEDTQIKEIPRIENMKEQVILPLVLTTKKQDIAEDMRMIQREKKRTRINISTQDKRKEKTRLEKTHTTGERKGRAINIEHTGKSKYRKIEPNIDNYSKKPSKSSSPT